MGFERVFHIAQGPVSETARIPVSRSKILMFLSLIYPFESFHILTYLVLDQ